MRYIFHGTLSLLLVNVAIGIMAAGVPEVPWEVQSRGGCPCSQEAPIPRLVTIDNTYMGLSQGPLCQARLMTLPKGVLLRAGKVIISNKKLSAEIASAKPDMQPILKKHGFFVLEQLATKQLLIEEARVWAKNSKRNMKKDTDAKLLQAYLTSIGAAEKVADAEVKTYYEANKEMVSGTTYESVAKDLKAYLLEQKQQEAVDAQVNTLSARTTVEVDRDWLEGQAATMLDNPVDKVRRSGKPSVIDFGREGCRPCDMMTPILEELRKTYAEQCNVLFCHVGDEPILAARYHVQSIPVQVFFDRDGNEVFRHVGFFPKEQMLAKLTELGVK